MSEIMKCKCGVVDIEVAGTGRDGDDIYFFTVRCRKCQNSINVNVKSRAEAIALWNAAMSEPISVTLESKKTEWIKNVGQEIQQGYYWVRHNNGKIRNVEAYLEKLPFSKFITHFMRIDKPEPPEPDEPKPDDKKSALIEELRERIRHINEIFEDLKNLD